MHNLSTEVNQKILSTSLSCVHWLIILLFKLLSMIRIKMCTPHRVKVSINILLYLLFLPFSVSVSNPAKVSTCSESFWRVICRLKSLSVIYRGDGWSNFIENKSTSQCENRNLYFSHYLKTFVGKFLEKTWCRELQSFLKE